LGIHMFTIRREQGRLNQLAPIMKLIAANNPQSSAWQPGLALIYSTLGMREESWGIFDALAVDRFAMLPQDSLWVATLTYLSETCAYLGDADRAATLYQLLLPYDGRAVVVGGATACYGAAARYLGMLAATMSNWETAERHFLGAIDLDASMEAWPWLGHSRYEYSAMLLRRGRAGDRQRAAALLDESLDAAQDMGMAYLAERVADLQARYGLISS
jgi:tetratricopeptide (TPR) repeat protein